MWKHEIKKKSTHDVWGRLRASARVDIRPKYPEKHSVPLVKNENSWRGSGPCLCASCPVIRKTLFHGDCNKTAFSIQFFLLPAIFTRVGASNKSRI